MPKNKGKGGKNRRRGKNDNEENKRELEFKEEGQGALSLYECWERPSGGLLLRRCDAPWPHPRQNAQKVWVGAGDIILVSLREYQDGKVDIIHKYNADEARSLKAYGELPDNARINETAVDMAMEGDGEDDIGFDFRRHLRQATERHTQTTDVGAAAA
ncbi:hypothetical protein PInf_002194 [Phytophthora infestans]|nr:hypothetical protein PInf_002194 [Phytophthora infestans]